MSENQFGPARINKRQDLGDTQGALSFPGEKHSESERIAEVKSVSTPTLAPEDKALFLEVWDLRDGELTDEQILIAIHLGHL